MGATRQTLQGRAGDLVAALAPEVHEKGKCWLKYDESSHVMSAKLDKDAILEHVELLQRLRDLAPNYSFKHSTAV